MVVSYPISLEVKEPNNDIGILRIRQSDEESQTLVVQVLEYGLKKSYENLQVFFCARIGQTAGLGIIEQKLTEAEMTDPKNGRFEYTFRAEDWQILGRQTGYFSFRKMTDDHTYVQQFSTRDFTYEVTKNIYSDGIKEVTKDGSTYVWTFEDLLRLLEEFKESGESDFLTWYEEIKDQLSEDAAGNLMLLYQSLRDKTGKDSDFRPYESDVSFMKRVFNDAKERGVNPVWFGAIGDGEADDTQAFTDAIASMGIGDSLIIPAGYKFKITEVVFDKPNCHIVGWGGTIASGYIYIKFSQKTEANMRVVGAIFENVSVGGSGIQLKNVRRIEITGCTFTRKGKAIHVPPHVATTTNPDNDELFHNVSMVNINNNHFYDCNQNVYIDYNTDTTNDVVPLDKRWMRTNDVHVSNNFTNNALINFIWARGLDGIIINGNTVFTKEKSTDKSHIIYIGKTDWFLASNNNLFEAGLSAIYLDDVKRVNINANNIPFPGQKEPSSAIVIGGYARGVVSNNIISSPTRYGIEVRSSASKIATAGNMYEYEEEAVTSRYYGDAAALTASTKKYMDSKGFQTTDVGSISDNQLTDHGSIRYKSEKTDLKKAWMNTTFTAGTPISLYTILDNLGNDNATASGLVVLNVNFSSESMTSNSGVYLLLISRSVSSTYNNVQIVSKGGMATSTSTSATNHPRFTFAIQDGKLVATPLDATAGRFYFNAISLGSIGLGRIS